MTSFVVDKLSVRIDADRGAMGLAAAQEGIKLLKALLKEKDEVNVVFAAAPSQAEMMQALVAAQDVDWGRVNALHMDNYIGLPAEDPRQFSTFLKDRLFGLIDFKNVYYMGIKAEDAARYDEIFAAHPVDLCFMGIGENAHIAFNDPDNAYFDDPHMVKQVELDLACRTQQVNEGNFPRIQDVPTHAITLTIPALMTATHLICTVPGANKADAAKCMLEGPIEEKCPASILRRHASAKLFLDKDAASKLSKTA